MKLREELGEREKRINTLSMPTTGKEGQLAESDVKGSKWYTECSSQRSDAEKKLKDLEAKLKDTRERWAVAKGEADRANQSIEELVQKYKKRWADVVTADTDRKEANGAGLPVELTAATTRIAELENKLVQALENVRQAGNVRKSLSEALALNEILQSKVDELQSKGGGKTSSSSSGKSSPVPDGGNNHSSSSGRSGSSNSSHGEGKTERIYKENKKIRKELAAALASKEAAKGKLEVRTDRFIRVCCAVVPGVAASNLDKHPPFLNNPHSTPLCSTWILLVCVESRERKGIVVEIKRTSFEAEC